MKILIHKPALAILILITLNPGTVKAQLVFNTLDSLLAYAEKNSIVSKSSIQQSLLAKSIKIAALANTVNFKSPVTFSATDNLKLPVNFIPAEAFGGPAGTFREITLGQEYVSNFNINPQIDIINLHNWAKVKSATLNKELTEVNNLIIKKALYENIAAAYYNITALEQQLKISEKSLTGSDSILNIVKNKFELGLVREQDLNNAKANYLVTADKLKQLNVLLGQQLNTLKILCDIPATTPVLLPGDPEAELPGLIKSTTSLQLQQSELQSLYARSELRANRMAMFPVISVFYYQGWQHNSNTAFFDSQGKWIQSQFIGLRISVPIPPDANRISQSYASKISWRIAKLNSQHSSLQTELTNRNIELEYEKSLSAYLTLKQIFELKNHNFQKSLNQYREGILPTDNLLVAFNELLASELNLVAAHSAVQFNKSKVLINNSVK